MRFIEFLAQMSPIPPRPEVRATFASATPSDRGSMNIQRVKSDLGQWRIRLSDYLIPLHKVSGNSFLRVDTPLHNDDARAYPHLAVLRREIVNADNPRLLRHVGSLMVMTSEVYVGMRTRNAPLPREVVEAVGHCMLNRFRNIEVIDVIAHEGVPELSGLNGLEIRRSDAGLLPDPAPTTSPDSRSPQAQ